ncbi:MAG: PAS domain-containing protein [Candidatus Micrarchaeota archaeon]
MRIKSKLILLFLAVGIVPLLIFEFLTIEVIQAEAPSVSTTLVARLYSLAGLMALFLALAVILVGLVISNDITKPLEMLTEAVDDISKGRLDTVIDPSLKESNDETGELAAAFDRTLVSLKLAIKQSAPELKSLLESKERNGRVHLESEVRFKAFMNSTRMVAWIKDEESRFVYVNEPFEKTFNRKLEDLLGKTDADIFPQRIAEMLRSNDAEVLKGGRQIEVEELVPTPDGKSKRWQVFKFPITLDSGKKYTGGFALEIKPQPRSKK